MHKRILVDSYSVVGNSLDVRGRYNSVSSTETDIERTLTMELEREEQKVAYEDEKVDGNQLASQPAYTIANRNFMNSVDPAQITFQHRTNAVNHSLKQMYYTPSGCQNAYKCFPKDMSTLYPYLTDHTVWDNLKYGNPDKTPLTLLPPRTFDPPKYHYRTLGGVIMGLYAGHATIAAPNNAISSVLNHGFNDSRYFVFQGQDEDGGIPCTLDGDQLVCHPAHVDIQREVFGLNAGIPTYRFVFAQPLFTLVFDEYGYANELNAAAYTYSAVLVNEYLQVPIRALCSTAPPQYTCRWWYGWTECANCVIFDTT